MKNVFLFAILLTLIVSCEKKPKETTEETEVTELCGSYLMEGIFLGDYNYIDIKMKGKLYDTIFIGEMKNCYLFKYEGSDKINKIEFVVDGKIRSYDSYYYSGNNVNRIDYFSFNDSSNDYEMNIYELFFYQGTQLVKYERYKPNDQITSFTNFEYDSRGNINKSNSFRIIDNDTVPNYKLEFTHDNQKASPPTFLLFNDFLFVKRMNNVLSRKYESYNSTSGTWSYSEFDTYSYEYNAKGYPVKLTNQKNETLNITNFDCE